MSVYRSMSLNIEKKLELNALFCTCLKPVNTRFFTKHSDHRFKSKCHNQHFLVYLYRDRDCNRHPRLYAIQEYGSNNHWLVFQSFDSERT